MHYRPASGAASASAATAAGAAGAATCGSKERPCATPGLGFARSWSSAMMTTVSMGCCDVGEVVVVGVVAGIDDVVDMLVKAVVALSLLVVMVVL